MDRVQGAGALLAVLVGGAVLVAVLAVLPSGVAPPPADSGWIGPSVWDVRGLDLAVQALLVLAGVFGVLVVLGREADG